MRSDRDLLAVSGSLLMILGFLFDDTDVLGFLFAFFGSFMVLAGFLSFVIEGEQYRRESKFVVSSLEARISYLEGVLQDNNIVFNEISGLENYRASFLTKSKHDKT